MPRDRKGYDNVLVMVCRLAKLLWSIPYTKNITARDAARIYYDGLFRVFRLPEEVISNRGPQFRANFTNKLFRILGVKWKLSSAGHL